MPKFNVWVTRTEQVTLKFEVEALDSGEAATKAESLASDTEYPRAGEAEYAADQIERVQEGQ